MASFWDVLEIGRTTDENEIKNAYRRKLVHTNPEDHPEEFKVLRRAYEDACDWAKKALETAAAHEAPGMPECEAGGQGDGKAPGQMPVQQWMARIEALYHDFYARIRPENWRSLLMDDVCVGLETFDEARRLLIQFFTGHTKLPHTVWQVIDAAFYLTDEQDELYEQFPEDFVDYLLDLIRYENFLDYSLFQGPPDADYDTYIDRYFDLRQAIAGKDLKKADQLYEALCSEMAPVYHPFTEVERANIALQQKNVSEARAVLSRLWADYAPCMYIGNTYSTLLIREKDYTSAMSVCEKMLETYPKSYEAGLNAAFCQNGLGKYAQAKEGLLKLFETHPGDETAMELLKSVNVHLMSDYRRILEDEPGNQTVQLDLGWCLCQNEDYEACLTMLENLEPDEKHLFDYVNLRGRIYLCLERYTEALPWLKRWREMILSLNDDGSSEYKKRKARLGYACYAIACCYSSAGEHGDADSYAQALKFIDLAIDSEHEVRQLCHCIYTKAELLHTLGRDEESLKLVKTLLSREPRYFPACLLCLEIYISMEMTREAIQEFYRAVRIYPTHPAPYEQIAKMLLKYHAENQAMAIIDMAEKMSAVNDALRLIRMNCLKNLAKSVRDYQMALSYFDSAMKAASKTRTNSWSSQMHRLKALCLLGIGRVPEAMETVLIAIGYDPSDDRNLEVKALCLEKSGQESPALKLYLELEARHPDRPFLAERIGKLYAARMELKKAVHYIEKMLALDKNYPGGYKLLGQLYFEAALANAGVQKNGQNMHPFQMDGGEGKGVIRKYELKKALDVFNQAAAVQKDAQIWMYRARIYFLMDDFEAAQKELMHILAGHPDDEEACIGLGLVYMRLHDYGRAFSCFEKSIKTEEHCRFRRDAYFYGGTCLEKLKNYEEALKYYGEGLARFPDERPFYKAMGLLLLKLERWDAAKEVYFKAFCREGWASAQLAEALCVTGIMSGDKKQIKLWRRKMEELGGERARRRQSLRAGQYYLYIENNPSRAIRSFKAALPRNSRDNNDLDDCRALYFLGCALALAGKVKKAADCFLETGSRLKDAVVKDTAVHGRNARASDVQREEKAQMVRLWGSCLIWLDDFAAKAAGSGQTYAGEKKAATDDQERLKAHSQLRTTAVRALDAWLLGDLEGAVRLFKDALWESREYDMEAAGMLRFIEKR